MSRQLAVAGQLAGIAVILLPAVGVVVRAIDFNTSSFGSDWYRIALADPVPTLAAIGFYNAVLPGAILLVVRLFARFEPTPHRSLPRPAAAALGFALVAAVLFLPTAFLVGVISGVLVSFIESWHASRLRQRGERLTLATAWPLVALLMVAGITVGILSGYADGVSEAAYTFDPQAQQAPGPYARLGESSDFLYIKRCSARNSPIVGVAKRLVLSESLVNPPSRSNTNLFDVIFSGRSLRVGLQLPC